MRRMRLPADPLTTITSPGCAASIASGTSAAEIASVAAAHRRRQGLVQVRHQRPGGEHQVDPVLDQRAGEAGVQAAASSPSSSMSPSTAMRRPPGPGRARPSTSKAAAIDGGLAL